MTTEDLTLRPIEDADIEPIHKLLNDSYSQQLVGGSVAPLSKSQTMAWLQEKRNAGDVYQFAIESSGEFCGYIQLAATNRIDGNATLGINILRKFQGKGLGRIAIQRMHEFAKHRLLLRKIVLYVRSDNNSAIRLYLKLGYQNVGNLAQHVKTENGYVDLKIMECML